MLSTAEDSSGAEEGVWELFFLDEVREEELLEDSSSSSSSEEVSVRPESLFEEAAELLELFLDEDEEL